MANPSRSALDLIRNFSAVGIALSSEKDNSRLMELILGSARELTSADGGTLYTRTDDDELRFEIMHTDSLGLRLGGSSGTPIRLPALPLYGRDGAPNDHMVAARAAVTGETVNVPDAYDAPGFDFSGTRAFDERTGYRSKSFLTVPMRNHEDEVIGVLQLINALDDAGAVRAFGAQDQLIVESLASQAAIALTKKRLIDEQRELFEAFIELIAAAIDDKSPYTGGHCRRVPELTMMLAEAAAAVDYGPLREFAMTEADRYELRIAGWLHDCGKVTTPEYVVDKATKLETIFDRIALVDTRFEVMRRDAELRCLRARVAALESGRPHDAAAAERALREELRALDEARAFLHRANKGGESMSADDQARVREIGRWRWSGPDGEERDFLSEEEVANLTIARGTLRPEEREVINHHIVATIKMLEALPYPKHLRRVPEFAGGHHERMDGRGYPRGLTREQMSVQARVMGIADIFEALTAADRPYKDPMPLSQALAILGRMKTDHHVDPDLFDVFVREKVYLRYAERFLPPEQIDDVDPARIPGFDHRGVDASREGPR
ncbi:MAG: GAF domain-containing protein [Ectothiorhodospiraceae bacterium]|nr:GAF domain-containing protein [Chromatiales bacterium]MCP5153944.1 GAF domain-containing protein [Ectothiorhodospiraceae bacterium]